MPSEPVKKSSKNRVRTAITSVISRVAAPPSSSDKPIWPSSSRLKKSIPTARTSGSAKGSSMMAFGSLLAIARAAATIVAVAPTLDAMSQLSASARVIARRRGCR